MSSIQIRYGVAAGAALVVLTTVLELGLGWGNDPETYRMAEALGYASILLSTSLIYFGVKRYRDTAVEGSIRFGKALLVGLVTDFTAASLYGAYMVVYFRWIAVDQPARYLELARDRIRESAASAEEIARQLAELDAQAELYLDPYFQGLVMFATVFVIGAVVSLVSAVILRGERGEGEGVSVA